MAVIWLTSGLAAAEYVGVETWLLVLGYRPAFEDEWKEVADGLKDGAEDERVSLVKASVSGSLVSFEMDVEFAEGEGGNVRFTRGWRSSRLLVTRKVS